MGEIQDEVLAANAACAEDFRAKAEIAATRTAGA